MASWNVWQWLIIISIFLMVIIPSVLQIYSYTKQVKIEKKWWYIIGTWAIFSVIIIIFAICWWQTSK